MAHLREVFAHNLKEKRRKCGFSQAKLAEKVGVSTHHIAMIELARNFPASDLIERIADELDIEFYELFITPLSSHEEMEKLYQTIAANIERIVDEAIQKAFNKKSRNKEE
jgi:transcriptional regulator with XRE-family HTH domain